MRIFGCGIVDIALLLNTLVEGIGGAITFGYPSFMPPPLGPKVAQLAGSGPVGSWVLHIIQGSTASLALLSLVALFEARPVRSSTILPLLLYHVSATYTCITLFQEKGACGLFGTI